MRREALHEYGVELDAVGRRCRGPHAIVAAVAHREFRQRPAGRLSSAKLAAAAASYIDVKCQADAGALRARGVTVWRL